MNILLPELCAPSRASDETIMMPIRAVQGQNARREPGFRDLRGDGVVRLRARRTPRRDFAMHRELLGASSRRGIAALEPLNRRERSANDVPSIRDAKGWCARMPWAPAQAGADAAAPLC
jgi:hypothetical protein